MNDPRRNAEMNRPRHRKYRLNRKKFVVMLLVLGITAAFIVVAVTSLANAEDIDVMANVMPELPEATLDNAEKTPEKQNGLSEWLIVLDAGHGGFDPGAIGVGGTHEDVLNLSVTKYLEEEFEAYGAEVIMTREDENAIAGDKDSDMAERRRIIEQSGSDIVISIHMNSFTEDPDVAGPLVLFMPDSTEGKILADTIQHSLNEELNADGTARSQSLFILQSGNQPCVLVECGYISNEEEERKLNQTDHQKRVAKAIFEGAKDYLS